MIGGSYKCPSPHQEQYSKLLSWHSPSHLRRGCPSDHDLKSGQICAAEKMKLDVVSDPSRSGTDRNRAGMREVHGQGYFDCCSPCSWRRGRAAVPVRQHVSPKSSNLNKPGRRRREACRRALAASQLKGQRLIRDCAKTPRCMEVTTHAPSEKVEHDA